jgi:hypothetical protein
MNEVITSDQDITSVCTTHNAMQELTVTCVSPVYNVIPKITHRPSTAYCTYLRPLSCATGTHFPARIIPAHPVSVRSRFE